MSNSFHLAIPAGDLEKAEAFYTKILGCKTGNREAGKWVDVDFWGNELTLHQTSLKLPRERHDVDMGDVPVPHFGIILDMQYFNKIASRLQKKEIKFIIEPTLRFKGEPGEQKTMFFYDPSFNAIEIKAFNDSKEIFRVS